MPDRPGPSLRRSDGREIAELRRVMAEQPELAGAVELQVALLQLQRRVKARIPVPWVDVDPEALTRSLRAGHPLLRFDDLPIAWGDFGLMLRETSSLLRRYDALTEEAYQQIQSLARDPQGMRPLLETWFHTTAHVPAAPPSVEPGAAAPEVELLDQVLILAMRPFLARSVESLQTRVDLDVWTLGSCPLCGGEPDFSLITASGDRVLVCSRCMARWRYRSVGCPFCDNTDPNELRSFTSHGGRYRVDACERCRRYVKAADMRRSDRPVMVAVDLIATLPLDAAVIQKGYQA